MIVTWYTFSNKRSIFITYLNYMERAKSIYESMGMWAPIRLCGQYESLAHTSQIHITRLCILCQQISSAPRHVPIYTSTYTKVDKNAFFFFLFWYVTRSFTPFWQSIVIYLNFLTLLYNNCKNYCLATRI